MPDLRYKALLIGNADFPNDPENLQPLKGPTRDVAILQEAITDPDVGLFASDNVKVLTDQPKPVIAAELERFFIRAARDDRLLLYYSGHGLLDQRNVLHLCAQDTQTDILKASSISANDINAMFDHSAAQTTIIVLDCCHSGAFKSGNLQDSLTGEGRFLFTSCRRGELAADADLNTGASIFTRHLVDGLRSGAADRNQDGYVNLGELYDFVHDALSRESKQIPQRSFAGGGDPAIAARGAHAKVLRAPPVAPDEDRSWPAPVPPSPPGRTAWWAVAAAGLALVAVAAAVVAVLAVRADRDDRADRADRVVAPITAATRAPVKLVTITNVFNLPKATAEANVRAQGFVVSSGDVCSSSVAKGRVRKVVRQGSSPEVVLVDESGVRPSGVNLAPGTKVVLHVSNGEPCTRPSVVTRPRSSGSLAPSAG